MAFHPRQLPAGPGAIRVTYDGRIATVALDHPAARNAVTPGMMANLGDIVDELESWDGVGVILTGVGQQAFCAGGDLNAVAAHWSTADAGIRVGAWMSSVLDRFNRLPMVTVAAVEGAALGGGAELLTAVDFVIAASDASIGFVHARLGVSPGWGGAQRLCQKVGGRAALRFLAFAERHDADAARALGLVDVVTSSGGALDAARRFLAPLQDLPPAAVQAAVRLARSGSRDDERVAFASLWGGPAHVAALKARGRGLR
jgi:ethylmalonyl-CoA/methylmalonyl-CoA decarboxylase